MTNHRNISVPAKHPLRVVSALFVSGLVLLGFALMSVEVAPPRNDTPLQAERKVVAPAPSVQGVTASADFDVAVEADPLPFLVPDPRPGDLSADLRADVLPETYSPAPAAFTELDVAYGSDPAQRLDVYLPTGSNAPVVLYLHSGGWSGGDKSEVPDFVMRFVERGYAVISANYRLAPQHQFPDPVHDVKHAIRWVKAFGEETGSVNGNRIVAFGRSAGGHLAAFVGTTAGRFEPNDLTDAAARFDSNVVGVVSVVGPTDLQSFYSHPLEWAREMTEDHVGCDPCANEVLAEASPLTHLHEDVPPAYWAYGGGDALVDADSQGAVAAAEWARVTRPLSSWFDLVNDATHNIDGSEINQRFLEAFVDMAIDQVNVNDR